MAGNMKPWTRRIYELLDSGPQRKNMLFVEIEHMIDAGFAYRKAEATRLAKHKRDVEAGKPTFTQDGRRLKGTEAEVIATGRRSVLNDIIHAGRNRKLMTTFKGEDGETYVTWTKKGKARREYERLLAQEEEAEAVEG